VGSLAGAALGSLLAALDVQPEFHFFAIAIAGCAALVWNSRFLFSSKQEQIPQKLPVQVARSFHISPTLMMLGVIAFCSLLSVGAMFDWSAVYLSGTLHTSAGLAATGFTTFLVCMALGRSVGDSLTIRFGAAVMVRIACSLAAIGLALALLSTWMPAVLFGLGLSGLGLSVSFPLVLSAAGRLRSSTIATVTTWGYAGMIVGPSMIGFLADRVGVRLALAPVVLLCLLAALCVTALKEDERRLPDCKQASSCDEDRSHV
jgi:fucose permease